jgi:hypothetical protein
MGRYNGTKNIVDHWIACLDKVDLADIPRLEEVLSRVPAELLGRIGDQGGSLIREKLLAPTLARMEREGLVEWTGEFHRNGQKIWRSLIIERRDASGGSDKS